MDPAYAKLSLTVGMLCGAADAYLGGSHFITKGRALAWDLTPEVLTALRQEARDRGVPDAVLAVSPDEVSPQTMEELHRLQDRIDDKSVTLVGIVSLSPH
jgi:hypothetical protein